MSACLHFLYDFTCTSCTSCFTFGSVSPLFNPGLISFAVAVIELALRAETLPGRQFHFI